MFESPDFESIAREVLDGLRVAPVADYDDLVPDVAEQLRLVWNARGAADRERIGEIIGEQREPDFSLRMAQESIKTLDR